MYLVDTNVISELRKPRPHGAVLAWVQSVDRDNLHICAVTLGEIQAGIEITREQDVQKAAEFEAWADQIVAVWNVIALDAAIFRVWAKLMHRRSPDLIEDAMIAATAQVHRLQIATRNVKDFKEFDVPVFNPFAFR